MQSTADPVERLRAAGLKVTSPRVAILRALAWNTTHPTAERLFEELRIDHPSLSLSTVYKTLEVFLRSGLCRRVPGDGGRLRVDGTGADHDHAVCRGCGAVYDVARDWWEMPLQPAALPNGLQIAAIRLEYEIVCADCETDTTDIATSEVVRPAAGG